MWTACCRYCMLDLLLGDVCIKYIHASLWKVFSQVKCLKCWIWLKFLFNRTAWLRVPLYSKSTDVLKKIGTKQTAAAHTKPLLCCTLHKQSQPFVSISAAPCIRFLSLSIVAYVSVYTQHTNIRFTWSERAAMTFLCRYFVILFACVISASTCQSLTVLIAWKFKFNGLSRNMFLCSKRENKTRANISVCSSVYGMPRWKSQPLRERKTTEEREIYWMGNLATVKPHRIVFTIA